MGSCRGLVGPNTLLPPRQPVLEPRRGLSRGRSGRGRITLASQTRSDPATGAQTTTSAPRCNHVDDSVRITQTGHQRRGTVDHTHEVMHLCQQSRHARGPHAAAMATMVGVAALPTWRDTRSVAVDGRGRTHCCHPSDVRWSSARGCRGDGIWSADLRALAACAHGHAWAPPCRCACVQIG